MNKLKEYSKQSTQTPILYSHMKTGNQIHGGCANCVNLYHAPTSCINDCYITYNYNSTCIVWGA